MCLALLLHRRSPMTRDHGRVWVAAALVLAGCGGEAAGTSEADDVSSSSTDGTGRTSSSTADATASGPSASTSSGPDDVGMTLPDEVGAGVETGYAAPASCCSRRSQTVSRSCPPGTNASNEGSFEAAGDTVALSNTLNTQAASLEVQALVAPADGEVTLTLTETDQLPPSGVLDLSPVFSVESAGDLPPMDLQIPMTSNQWMFPFEGSGVYFSTDNERFTLIGDSRMNAGFMQATLQGAGYFFVGSVASEDECGNL